MSEDDKSPADELAARRNRKKHNTMLIDRIVGVPAHSGTPETDADPNNPFQGPAGGGDGRLK